MLTYKTVNNVCLFKGNQPIKQNSTEYLLLDDGWTLEISEAKRDDSTRFTCRAQNEAGVNEKAFDVNVLGKGILQY